MKLQNANLISLSIVSHGQIEMVTNLLSDIEKHCLSTPLEVLLTINIPEKNEIDIGLYSYPIKIIENAYPKGFGANHNQAFSAASGVYFCVLNPDIRFIEDPFPTLLNLVQDPLVGVCAPQVIDKDGKVEDSARRFPNPWTIFKRLIIYKRSPDYVIANESLLPDWVGGMFMLFRSAIYQRINGFDERYFLYYEDVDICARLTNSGFNVVLCPQSVVVHLAQRASHRNIKYLRWHVTSMLRFFMTPSYWHLL
jgi:N-acetylglucosaminyl-diphospho-decaprenol L-rhamnosyltransferase